MDENIYKYMDWPRIEGIVYGEEASPKDILAPRLTPDGVLIQGYFPEAQEAVVLAGRKKYPMELEDEAGYYAALIPGRKIPQYRFQIKRAGKTETFYDSYAFPGQITQEEEDAFCAGVYYHASQKLGAHPLTINGVEGTSFAVWAPNAMRVSVIGEFNDWDGRRNMMHRMPKSGIYELFVPGVEPGETYKYEIKLKNGEMRYKADPYAFCGEIPPADGSVVADLRSFVWTDQEWIKKRDKKDVKKEPVSILETSLTAWKDGEELAAFAKKLGYTHVELHPVMEYLKDEYSTSSYYAPTRRFGMPEDFQKLVDRLHCEEIGVILDWTPAQFPRNESGLEAFDGTPLYEIQDPAYAVHPMWGTMLYNYGSPMVKDFLIANAVYWIETYHVDGFRMDDVDSMLYLDYGRKPGEWLPNIYGTNENLDAVEFLKHLNSILKQHYPGIVLIAQEDGLWPELTDCVENDHLGFDFKWSGGWTKDFLSYLSNDPIERKNYHDQLTLSMLYAYSERYVLTLGSRDVGGYEDFLEKLPGDENQKKAQVREAYAYMTLHPGRKMSALFSDAEEGIRECIRDLNAMYKAYPALYEKDDEYDGFEWVQLMKYEENVITFLRKTDKPEETLLAICNFAAVPYEDYQVGVPFYGKYKEIFNSDHKKYGGGGAVNSRVKTSKKEECDERSYSIRVKLPSLGVSVFSCTPEEEPAVKKMPAVKKEAAPKQEAEASKEKKKKTTGKRTRSKKKE